MTEDAKIRAAWSRYHGRVFEDEGYIPATPPTYERGYLDGYAAGMIAFTREAAEDAAEATAEIRAVLAQLDRIDAVWGDGAAMTACRDRLRKLVTL